MDSNARLIQEGCQSHRNTTNLRFAVADIYDLPCTRVFDIATAARVLQWLTNPQRGLEAMRQATRRGGRIVVLDYNHEKVGWEPAPPASMQRFYTAFLKWRAEVGMDNAIADHLVSMFRSAGLTDIREKPQHEVATKCDADFAARMSLWAEVAATRGIQMVADGLISEPQRAAAETEYREWARTEAKSQTLYLLAVEGVVA